ncbi:MAG: glycosyltransferase family 25 protein [Parachlamydiaceae bacterium]|nr:glycosyltransferase family 25 protein [Parachlamydiaceae bacterium]
MYNLLIRNLCLTILLVFFSTPLDCKPFETLFKPHPHEPRSSIKGVNGVYLINLNVRPEKWHRMETILYYHGVDFTRFSAVLGMDFDVPTIMQYCTLDLNVGALGCMLSHLSIYQDAIKRSLKTIWVLEDDVEIWRDPKVLTGLIGELDVLDPEWDILYTDLDFINERGLVTYNQCFPNHKKYPLPHSLEYYLHRENISKNIQLIRYRYGMASMIVSERGMKKILNYFTTDDDIVFPIDIELHFIPGIRQYGVINPVASNYNSNFNVSDTGKGSGLKNFYEIDDNHVKYVASKLKTLEELKKNCKTIFPIPNQPQTEQKMN